MVTKDKLNKLLAELEATTTLEGLQKTIVRSRHVFGVDHIVYHWVDCAGEQYGCGSYSLDWIQRYVDMNYLRVDPVVIGCYQRFHPIDWKRLDWSGRAAREFFADAQQYGVGNQGYSIPIRGPSGQFALFTASHNCDDATWAEFIEINSRDLLLMAHYLNRKALEFEPGRRPEQVRSLSPREIDAMTLLAMGYSRAQVASTLSISEHTLRAYIESARFKLGAQNTTHAVARAINFGLIVV
ncbi:helix-turn-helix transcriptional regulator [Albibacillus kandeliae]|uniref:helix-turn-helix transcriptional regulator n=1 Tax=Albibacillus kandeliae TaxID=2174228 RepID=UPI000D69749E|nr:LuxR family transcriptional regulator [Albibacillus kandeliae]